MTGRGGPLTVSVVGTGYLGATHAVCMAVLGHQVVGVDRDPAKVAALSEGTVPFYEPGLEELLRSALGTGRLRFTTDLTEVAGSDVHFLCVGTPQRPGSGAADLTALESVVRDLAPLLRERCLVVGKSTVPVGTSARLAAMLHALAPADVDLAWNPEFLREGLAVEDTLRPERLVIGVGTPYAREVLEDCYRPLLDDGVPCVVTDTATSELVKVAANSFLATKISYINAMAEVCEATGADVTDLAKALALDSRIGGAFLRPGLGFGGGCLPKDLRAFAHRAEEVGVGQAVSFLHDVDAINLRRRLRVVDLVRDAAGGDLTGVRVCLLGAAFKPGSDDVRDSPALDVARMLHAEGADVVLTDPQAGSNARRVLPDVRHVGDALTAATRAQVVALLTEWDDYRSLDPVRLGRLVAARNVVDARHALDPQVWRDAGWSYSAPGTGSRVPAQRRRLVRV